MEKFNNRATRGLSYLLIYLTAIQPLHPAFAALTPDGPRTQVNNAGAVPVVNIATPNAAGVSHNTYKDFSVGTPGAVLNNSITAGQSQLAGQVNANANLNGKAAGLIINEVTGSTRSDLQGKVEVFGNKANVLIANPNGITCDGCGFINTPSATLTTGKPVLDQQGALEALEIKKGSITIGGKGLDGSATDYVDILSRATELNGKINAKSLTLTQGSNRVDFKTGTIAPIVGEGEAPLLAVDTKALGGMYAERIRLVATEDGVGANVANLTSSQQGITLDSKGKIQLGNVHAKTDLNLTAQQVDIAAGNTVKSDRDITLASTTLNNQGNIVASQDMRLFNDNLTNTQATIEANNNLWIQKDATGNKGVKVENRSGTIKTNTGDLVVRTNSLQNVRDKIVVKEKKDLTYANLNIGSELPIRSISDTKTYTPLIVKKELEGDFATSESEIHGAKNLYINATRLENNASSLKSLGNIFLAGENFLNISPLLKQTEHTTSFRSETAQEQAVRRSNTPQSASTTILDDGTPLILAYYRVKDKESEFKGEQLLSAKVQATGNVVADFRQSIGVTRTQKPTSQTSSIFIPLEKINIKGRSVLLQAGTININGEIESDSDTNLISQSSTNIKSSHILSKYNDININSVSSILSTNSLLRARNINLTSRESNIAYDTDSLPLFSDSGERAYALLFARENLALTAGSSIYLSGVNFGSNQNTTFVAKRDIVIKNSDYDLITHKKRDNQANDQKTFDDAFFRINNIFSSNSILAKAEGNLILSGISFTAGKNIDLISNGKITVDNKKTGSIYNEFLPLTRTPELSSSINSRGNLLISSGDTLNLKSANLSATNNISLLAGNSISLLSTAYSAIATPDEDNRDERHVITQINARGNLTLATNGALIASGSSFSSIGDMTLSSREKMEFNALKNYAMREGNNEFNESTTQQNVVLNSGGVLTLLSGSSILFQATSLLAKGAMDVAAKGGFLYAQAMEETNHYEQESSSRTWYGKKKKGKQTYHNVSNKVTEFTAGSDINLLSRDDSIYEASKIEAGKNAKLTSTQGKVIFKAVKNTTFEQTITSSKGFFIKNSDRGYTKDTWLLPSIHAGGQFTVDAATGVSAAVKTRNAQSLQNALLTLSNTPGATWLKGLNTRKDVQWNAVQDAYTNWNHTTQSLNPVVGAVIAIAVAAVTAGAGLAGMAATATVNAAGATGMTATVMSGAVYSGMTALTSQAAVALVDNKGNLTKTMQTLGNSASVKSLVTSMVVGGALAGFDSVLKVSNTGASPAQTKLPMLSNGDWNKVAQRIAGQSVISSSIGTAINGGSFKDNFTTALLSNVGNQINAEGAKFIGDNGAVLDVPGKALSHAVVAGVAAEISGGNVKGAAAGALAAELAGAVMGSSLFEPKYKSELDKQVVTLLKIAQQDETSALISRVIGSLAGAIATNSPGGVNSAANAAEITYRYNFLEHEIDQMFQENANDIVAAKKGDKAAQERVDARMAAAMIIMDFTPVAGGIKSALEAQTALDYLLTAAAIIPGLGAAGNASIKQARKYLDSGKIKEAEAAFEAVKSEIALIERPSWRKSETDIGKNLGEGWREQISFKGGKEVPYGTSGSVRPDWCLGTICSIEVKNYNLATNQNGLINIVSKQAIERKANLPAGMRQEVIIDIRGQTLTTQQRAVIRKSIAEKSNGSINPSSIRFKTE
ncbi:DUF637 domain-containing protein [Pectobacterium punjabense]|uniref:DUF637 domain-containing protein n=1 Tax=Pectobacterium punjabense TaxID=2108399 RepID=UPI002B2410B4|nr:DUF637 domain-containing protein [Pectobacterium punjabense]